MQHASCCITASAINAVSTCAVSTRDHWRLLTCSSCSNVGHFSAGSSALQPACCCRHCRRALMYCCSLACSGEHFVAGMPVPDCPALSRHNMFEGVCSAACATGAAWFSRLTMGCCSKLLHAMWYSWAAMRVLLLFLLLPGCCCCCLITCCQKTNLHTEREHHIRTLCKPPAGQTSIRGFDVPADKWLVQLSTEAHMRCTTLKL